MSRLPRVLCCEAAPRWLLGQSLWTVSLGPLHTEWGGGKGGSNPIYPSRVIGAFLSLELGWKRKGQQQDVGSWVGPQGQGSLSCRADWLALPQAGRGWATSVRTTPATGC